MYHRGKEGLSQSIWNHTVMRHSNEKYRLWYMEISCTTERWFTSKSDTNMVKLNCYHFLCSDFMFLCLHFFTVGNQANCPWVSRFDICTISLKQEGNGKERHLAVYNPHYLRSVAVSYVVFVVYLSLENGFMEWMYNSQCNPHAKHITLFPLMDCLWSYLSNKTWWGIALQPVKEKVTNVFRPWSVDSLDGGSTDAMKIPPIEK